jgi:hypothetical protein
VNIGTVFSITGNFSIALQYMLDALEIFEQSGETEGTAWTSLSISRLFSRLEINERALQYAENALNHYRRLGNQTESLWHKPNWQIFSTTPVCTIKPWIYWIRLLMRTQHPQHTCPSCKLPAKRIIYFDKKLFDKSEHYLNLSLR